jgi:hypothetical protein
MHIPRTSILEQLSPEQTDDRMVEILGYPPFGHPGDPFGGRAAWRAHREFLAHLANSSTAGEFAFPGRTSEESISIARAATKLLHRHQVAFNEAEKERMRARWKFVITGVAVVVVVACAPFLVSALFEAIA